MNLGMQVKQVRLSLRLTQDKFAKKIGYTMGWINRAAE